MTKKPTGVHGYFGTWARGCRCDACINAASTKRRRKGKSRRNAGRKGKAYGA
jgi:hypothetical protein